MEPKKKVIMAIEASPEKMLELGIEIVASMHAGLFQGNMEAARIETLSDTEIDRLELFTIEEYEKLSAEDKERINKSVEFSKERMHKQARFAATVALKKISEMALAICGEIKSDEGQEVKSTNNLA